MIQRIIKLLVYNLLLLNTYVYSYQIYTSVSDPGYKNLIHESIVPIQYSLPSQMPRKNCYFESQIIDCYLVRPQTVRTKIGYDPTQSRYTVDSNTDINFRMNRRKKDSQSTKKNTGGRMLRVIKYHSPSANHLPSVPSNRENSRRMSLFPSIKKNLLWNVVDFLLPQQNSNIVKPTSNANNKGLFNNFMRAHESFDRKFYNLTFYKLLKISPSDRRVNGISFVYSGLLLQILLIALSAEADLASKDEIEKCTGIYGTKSEKTKLMNKTLLELPVSNNNDLKFYWSYRLVLWPGTNMSQGLSQEVASAIHLHKDKFNGTEQPDQIAKILNEMIEKDSGGAIRDTFDSDELSDGVDAVLMNTLYMRARWRSAPTVLNGSRPFRDAVDAPQRMVRMIRINDIMRYADLTECNAEAVEIFYATSGLSLLILVPRNGSLQNLANHIIGNDIIDIVQRMRAVRVAATIPLYTLRMTLLLPNKLQAMGITRILNKSSDFEGKSVRISHAVQRLMFWAEAGRNAFKDDGLEWDESPEFELVVDRPYIFFVRWNNLTLMNGNFVL